MTESFNKEFRFYDLIKEVDDLLEKREKRDEKKKLEERESQLVGYKYWSIVFMWLSGKIIKFVEVLLFIFLIFSFKPFEHETEVFPSEFAGIWKYCMDFIGTIYDVEANILTLAFKGLSLYDYLIQLKCRCNFWYLFWVWIQHRLWNCVLEIKSFLFHAEKLEFYFSSIFLGVKVKYAHYAYGVDGES